jgi:hypothetical protein
MKTPLIFQIESLLPPSSCHGACLLVSPMSYVIVKRPLSRFGCSVAGSTPGKAFHILDAGKADEVPEGEEKRSALRSR